MNDRQRIDRARKSALDGYLDILTLYRSRPTPAEIDRLTVRAGKNLSRALRQIEAMEKDNTEKTANGLQGDKSGV